MFALPRLFAQVEGACPSRHGFLPLRRRQASPGKPLQRGHSQICSILPILSLLAYSVPVTFLRRFSSTFLPAPLVLQCTPSQNTAGAIFNTSRSCTVSKTQWNLFHERTREAKELLLQAATLQDKNAYWYEVTQIVAFQEGWGKTEARAYSIRLSLSSPATITFMFNMRNTFSPMVRRAWRYPVVRRGSLLKTAGTPKLHHLHSNYERSFLLLPTAHRRSSPCVLAENQTRLHGFSFFSRRPPERSGGIPLPRNFRLSTFNFPLLLLLRSRHHPSQRRAPLLVQLRPGHRFSRQHLLPHRRVVHKGCFH